MYGKNPTIEPANAVINTIAIRGDSFNAKIINRDIHEINVIPEDNPSSPTRLVTIWGLGYKWITDNQ